jgi:GTP pyrophosphokinase
VLDVADVKNHINEIQNTEQARELEQKTVKTGIHQGKGNDDILVIDAKNVRGIDYRMAKCCNPVFGDDVFGFVTRTEGIKIHRMSCPNAARLLEMYPYRIQKVKWSENPSTGNFQTGLRVITALEPSAINEVMDVVNSFRASIRMFNVSENDRNGTYDITMKIAVPSNLELDKVISQMRIQKNVLKISRM